MTFLLIAVYLTLAFVFIVDVVRRPSSQLSGIGKALWIVALLVVPVIAWITYGVWRMQTRRRELYGG